VVFVGYLRKITYVEAVQERLPFELTGVTSAIPVISLYTPSGEP
jgi:hypothetical protein